MPDSENDNRTSPPQRRKNLPLLLAILAAVCALFTLAVINYSFERGRLQYEIDYEDVISFLDGLKRYKDLVHSGARHFVAEYLKTPPHAPLHSGMVAASFLLFGVRDWAPYAIDGVLLFAWLGAFLFLAKTLPAYARAAGVLLLLATPLAFHTIHEFRPDYPNALANVWGILFFFEFLSKRKLWLAAASGACFGVALLAKPPVFLYVLAMGGGCILGGAASFLFSKNKKNAFVFLRDLWPFFLGCAAIAGPHFIVAAKKIWDYFLLNQFGPDSHIWAFHEGWGIRLSYFFTGYGGELAFGRIWWIAPLALLSAFFLAIARRKMEPEIARHCSTLFGMAAYSYFFLAINPHMNPFFGLTFQFLVLLAAALCLAWAIGNFQKGFFHTIAAGFATLVLLLVLALDFPLPVRKIEITCGPEGSKKFHRDSPKKVIEFLKNHLPFLDGNYVLMTSYGSLSAHTLQWMADKQSLPAEIFTVPNLDLKVLEQLFSQDSAKHRRVDIAIASEPGILGLHDFLPSAKTAAPLLSYLRKHPEYLETAKISDPNGKSYFLFVREPHFSPLQSVSGLSEKLPPQEKGSLPARKVFIAPKQSWIFASPENSAASLELEVFSENYSGSCSVSLDGKTVGIFSVSPKEKTSISLSLNLLAGNNPFELQWQPPLQTPADRIFFTKLRILKTGGPRAVEQLYKQWTASPDEP